MTISIDTPTTMAEFEHIEQLQAQIWGSLEAAVPAHLLLTFVKENNVVLLMCDGQQPIGFAFGFLARTADGQLKLASHQAGIIAGYRGQGLGYRLKLAQRKAVLAQGLTLITWTYDPLQAANARLNLAKLGATCNTYIPDYYGEMTDKLNHGLPSDRFRVEWQLTSARVEKRLAGLPVHDNWPANSPLLNPHAPTEEVSLPGDAPFYRVEIPSDINTLKQHNPQAALRWRLNTRRIMQTAFEQGYSAVDLLRQDERVFYLLQKDWQPA